MPDVSVLEVALHGQRIGTLSLLPGDQTMFAFDQAYIDDDGRPTLSLSFKDTLGDLITDVQPTRRRVPPFFANLLPEGALRDYLAKRAGVNPKREFFLLWLLGRDLPGALTITPADGEAWPPETDGGSDEGQFPQNALLRFSLAGVQLKFSAVMEATGGLTIPAEGVGGSWIIKLPMKFEGVPENEYAMMELARTIGINVPEVRLIPLDQITGLPDDVTRMKGNALAVKRFDRAEDGSAVHIEDFAQVFGLFPERKYERASYRNIAEVLWAETGADGVAEFVRRLVFNTLIGNADMHLKNWSLIYSDGRQAQLAPGYDFVSTIAYLPDTDMALTLGRSKAMSELSLEQLAYLAGKALLPKKLVLDTGNETVELFMDAWKDGKAIQAVSPQAIEPVNNLLAQIPLVQRGGR
ncbi:MAG: HipA domain-containing protein [Candidatus Thiodiazotropha sp. (ex Ustalcina ferruginea)]|nr:HipA domain-containing protein [Candidatus Thiodiazotropha sp. (ex Ustalcina ferruginea)]